MATDKVTPPTGRPTASSTASDVRWALDKARRFLFAGGQWVEVEDYIDAWLDHATEHGLAGDIERSDKLPVA